MINMFKVSLHLIKLVMHNFSYGFHETCLLRSVCELARHPFADDQQNILTEILTFILTYELNCTNKILLKII